MSQGKILDIHGQKNRVSAITLEKQRLSSSPCQDLGSRDLVFPLGGNQESTEGWEDHPGDAKVHLLSKGSMALSARSKIPWQGEVKTFKKERWRWEHGDSRTDPTSLQKAGLQLFPTSHAPAVWNLLSSSHPPTPSFLNAPSPVLCEQPKSALDCRTASSLPPLGRNPWSVPSTLRIQVDSSQVCSHQPPQALLPWVLLAILRPPAPQPGGQPTSGRASVKVRDKRALAGSSRVHSPWCSSLIGQRKHVNIRLLHHFLWDKVCQPILIVGGLFRSTFPLELWDNHAQNSRIQILYPWDGEGSHFSEIKWFFSFRDT